MINIAIKLATIVLVGATAGSFQIMPSTYRLYVGQVRAASPLDEGSPGVSPTGLICLRTQAQITILPKKAKGDRLDFAELAAEAINRDLFPKGKWDGAWDQSLMVDTGIVFDARGVAYTLVIPRYSNMKNAALLWSDSGCRNWHAVRLASRNATLEKPSAFNDRNGPPTISSFEYYGALSGKRLWLDRFVWQDRKLAPASGFPKLVATDSLLPANHSGGGNSTLTTADKIFVVYPTTDTSAAGTQSVARQMDLQSGQWEGPAVEIGRSTTAKGPDPHDLPAIAQLPSGKLVVVIGAHHALFRIFESNSPHTIAAGWGAQAVVGDPSKGRSFTEYSYVSLNISHSGTMNIIARDEGDQGRYTLVQFRKLIGGTWDSWADGTPHRAIAVPGRVQYVAWRQRVSEGPSGLLYLNFAFYPNMLTDAEATQFGVHKNGSETCDKDRCWYAAAPTLALHTLVSSDDGLNWR